MKPSFTPAAICLFLLATSFSAAAAGKRENTIILDEPAVRNLRLETVEVQESKFEETIFALGRIQPMPGKRVIVSARVAGRAAVVAVERDQAVKQGDEILQIESRQPGDPPPMIKLVAPISGHIAGLDVAPGQPVSPDDSLMEIIDSSEVHGVAQVPEHLTGRLTPGQKAHIRVPAFRDEVFEADLEHLAAAADAETLSLQAVFHVPNPEQRLRPGMRAEFSIVVSERDGVMSIPREALQGDAGGRFVYIADYELPNAFVKVPVQVGTQNDRFVEITNGLLPGDEVVTRGAYALGFAGKGSVSLKEAMDAAHGHPHNEDGSEMTKEQRAAALTGGPAKVEAAGMRGATLFFAGTSVLLLVLLLWSLKRKSASPTP